MSDELEWCVLFLGTYEERGITAWQTEMQTGADDDQCLEPKLQNDERLQKLSKVLYVVPGINKIAKRVPGFRFIPVCPGYNVKLED